MVIGLRALGNMGAPRVGDRCFIPAGSSAWINWCYTIISKDADGKVIGQYGDKYAVVLVDGLYGVAWVKVEDTRTWW